MIRAFPKSMVEMVEMLGTKNCRRNIMPMPNIFRLFFEHGTTGFKYTQNLNRFSCFRVTRGNI